MAAASGIGGGEAVRAEWATMVAKQRDFGCRQIQRLGAVAMPVMRPELSRNVTVPLLSRVAVPVVRPAPSDCLTASRPS